jgi:nucleoside 2-deoxyribosyltransferase
MKSVYLIGSLRNPEVPKLAAELRAIGLEVFDDWFSAGFEADDWWQKYETARGHDFAEALAGYAAQHVYQFDLFHLKRCDAAILLLPAGKSGHLELGFMVGSGKPGYILMDKKPDRFDVMYNFATGVYFSRKELLDKLRPDVVPF